MTRFSSHYIEAKGVSSLGDGCSQTDEQRSGDILSLCNYDAVFVQSCNWSLAAASNVYSKQPESAGTL